MSNLKEQKAIYMAEINAYQNKRKLDIAEKVNNYRLQLEDQVSEYRHSLEAEPVPENIQKLVRFVQQLDEMIGFEATEINTVDKGEIVDINELIMPETNIDTDEDVIETVEEAEETEVPFRGSICNSVATEDELVEKTCTLSFDTRDTQKDEKSECSNNTESRNETPVESRVGMSGIFMPRR